MHNAKVCYNMMLMVTKNYFWLKDSMAYDVILRVTSLSFVVFNMGLNIGFFVMPF